MKFQIYDLKLRQGNLVEESIIFKCPKDKIILEKKTLRNISSIFIPERSAVVLSNENELIQSQTKLSLSSSPQKPNQPLPGLFHSFSSSPKGSNKNK